jgi:hypothetical protein
MEDTIKVICKKHPHLSKHIIANILPIDSNFNTVILKDIIDQINTYKSVLKTMEFNFFDHQTLESITDAMGIIIKDHAAKVFLKKNISQKDRGLVNSTTYNHIVDCVENKIPLNELRDEVFNKIAKFKTKREFNTAIKSFIRSKESTSVLQIWNGIRKNNVKLVKMDEDDKILVVQINDYESSNIIGSHSWCISTRNSYWNDYVQGRGRYDQSKYTKQTERILKKIGAIDTQNTQLFIWNLKDGIESKKTMIGMTYSDNLSTQIASHWKNDDHCKESIYDYLNQSDIDLFLQNKNWNINFIVDKMKNEKFNATNIILTVLEVDKNKIIEVINNNNWQDDDKVNQAVTSHCRNAINKSFKDGDITIFTDSIVLLKKISISNFQKSKLVIFKDFLDQLQNFKIPESDTPLNDIGIFIDKIEKSFEIVADDRIEAALIYNYISKQSTVKIELSDVRNLVDKVLIASDFSKPNFMNNTIAKILIRSYKTDNSDWIKPYINKGITAKILTFGSIIKYMEENVDFFNDITKKINNYDNFKINTTAIKAVSNIQNIQKKDIVLSLLSRNQDAVQDFETANALNIVVAATRRSPDLFDRETKLDIASAEIRRHIEPAIKDEKHPIWDRISNNKDIYVEALENTLPGLDNLLSLLPDRRKKLSNIKKKP